MDWMKELAALPKTLRATLIAALALLVALILVNQPLQTGSAPQGIVSFQMAGTADRPMPFSVAGARAAKSGLRSRCGSISCLFPPICWR